MNAGGGAVDWLRLTFRHHIDAAWMEGMAPCQPTQGETDAAPGAMCTDRFLRVVRTGGIEAALSAEYWAERQLITPYCAEQNALAPRQRGKTRQCVIVTTSAAQRFACLFHHCFPSLRGTAPGAAGWFSPSWSEI